MGGEEQVGVWLFLPRKRRTSTSNEKGLQGGHEGHICLQSQHCRNISSLWSVHSTNTSDSSLEQGDMLRGRTTVQDETCDL